MPDNPDTDPFKPPRQPILVSCLHCEQEYESYLIRWEVFDIEGKKSGFWMCPTPGCDGKGFGFDIFPVDPDWVDPEGNLTIIHDDDEGVDLGEVEGDSPTSDDRPPRTNGKMRRDDDSLEPPF